MGPPVDEVCRPLKCHYAVHECIDFLLGFLTFFLSLPFMLVCHSGFPVLISLFALLVLYPLTTIIIPLSS